MGELSKFKFISLQNFQQYQVRGVEGKGGGGRRYPFGQCAEMHFFEEEEKKVLVKIIQSGSCDIRTKNNREDENPKRLNLSRLWTN